MSWTEVTLNEISETQYGYTASATDEPIGPKFLRITDIVNDTINWNSVPYCPINENDLDKYLLRKGDIVIARTGATTGYAKLIRENDNKAVFASYLVRLKINQEIAAPGFVGRLLESHIYRKFVEGIKGGAAQPNANAKTLTLFKFSLPDLTIQERIVDVLSKYDDLIENNKRRIELLEDSARQLYKEWFVRFRFPGHEHVKIIDGVPEGWKKKPLKELLTLNYGKALKAEDRIPGNFPVYGSSGVVGTHTKPLVKGPGIIVGRKGNVGSIFWSHLDFFPIDTVYFVSAEDSNYFIYYALLHTAFISTDVAVPGLNRDFAYSREIVVPIDVLISEFEDEVAPIFKQCDVLSRYNDQLVQARDLLLPKLMSGEIAV
jgi:type I restriction enzyme S subunit